MTSLEKQPDDNDFPSGEQKEKENAILPPQPIEGKSGLFRGYSPDRGEVRVFVKLPSGLNELQGRVARFLARTDADPQDPLTELPYGYDYKDKDEQFANGTYVRFLAEPDMKAMEASIQRMQKYVDSLSKKDPKRSKREKARLEREADLREEWEANKKQRDAWANEEKERQAQWAKEVQEKYKAIALRLKQPFRENPIEEKFLRGALHDLSIERVLSLSPNLDGRQTNSAEEYAKDLEEEFRGISYKELLDFEEHTKVWVDRNKASKVEVGPRLGRSSDAIESAIMKDSVARHWAQENIRVKLLEKAKRAIQEYSRRKRLN